MADVAGLILAAGVSRRFGGRKQLAQVAGQTLLNRAIDRMQQALGAPPLVVLGAFYNDIAASVAREVPVVFNGNWSLGMGSSIAVGVKALTEDGRYHGVMIGLCDQVALTAEDYGQLLAAFDGVHPVATEHPPQLGVPAIFPATFFPALCALSSTGGARELLQQNRQSVIAVSLANASVDIDSQEDLQQALARC
ncbi:nucleotidyltransferase family protein [Gallaecimonas mangrovi]|uniref:nucleotidyltransferase family protein n=1 Tax=Gallaecimonas mangrovi TaxID=2291597 RepID=UPI001865BF18|nr:nucleotidyltransferase family protein [Gallaecimonas mangrovi]